VQSGQKTESARRCENLFRHKQYASRPSARVYASATRSRGDSRAFTPEIPRFAPSFRAFIGKLVLLHLGINEFVTNEPGKMGATDIASSL
jgi:hypothetical protein